VLSRRLASSGHYPAVDVLESISRVMPSVSSERQRQAATRMLDMMATYREAEDLINIGAYVKGSNPKIDESVSRIAAIRSFLRQRSDERAKFEDSILGLISLMQ